MDPPKYSAESNPTCTESDAARLAAELAARARYAAELVAGLPDDEASLAAALSAPPKDLLRRVMSIQAAVYGLAEHAVGLTEALMHGVPQREPCCTHQQRSQSDHMEPGQADLSKTNPLQVAEHKPAQDDALAQVQIGFDALVADINKSQDALVAKLNASQNALVAELNASQDALVAKFNTSQTALRAELAELRADRRNIRSDLDETQEALFDLFALICMVRRSGNNHDRTSLHVMPIEYWKPSLMCLSKSFPAELAFSGHASALCEVQYAMLNAAELEEAEKTKCIRSASSPTHNEHRQRTVATLARTRAWIDSDPMITMIRKKRVRDGLLIPTAA